MLERMRRTELSGENASSVVSEHPLLTVILKKNLPYQT